MYAAINTTSNIYTHSLPFLDIIYDPRYYSAKTIQFDMPNRICNKIKFTT